MQSRRGKAGGKAGWDKHRRTNKSRGHEAQDTGGREARWGKQWAAGLEEHNIGW